MELYLYTRFPSLITHHRAVRIIGRTITSSLCLLIAMTWPGFHRMMGLLGSAFAFTVSAVFPIMCYLKLFGVQELNGWEKIGFYTLIVFCGICGMLGTVWSFLP